MADPFESHVGGLSSPASDGFAITPADSDLANTCRAIYVGGAGNLRVTTVAGADLTFVGVTAGTILPVRAKRVWTTNTTATNLVGLN